jgi:hypothetical protein
MKSLSTKQLSTFRTQLKTITDTLATGTFDSVDIKESKGTIVITTKVTISAVDHYIQFIFEEGGNLFDIKYF